MEQLLCRDTWHGVMVLIMVDHTRQIQGLLEVLCVGVKYSLHAKDKRTGQRSFTPMPGANAQSTPWSWRLWSTISYVLWIHYFYCYLNNTIGQFFTHGTPTRHLSNLFLARPLRDNFLSLLIDGINIVFHIVFQFECCGVSNSDDGFKDWQDNMYFNCSAENPSVEKCGVPHSCCRLNPVWGTI